LNQKSELMERVRQSTYTFHNKKIQGSIVTLLFSRGLIDGENYAPAPHSYVFVRRLIA
jgi:hypothetical protein